MQGRNLEYSGLWRDFSLILIFKISIKYLLRLESNLLGKAWESREKYCLGLDGEKNEVNGIYSKIFAPF